MTQIILVDPDADLSTLLAEVFAEHGWETIPCRRAEEALPLIREQQPAVILLDVWLGTSSCGWQLLEQLQQDPATRNVPLIVCSSVTDQLATRDEWLRRHDISSVPKPFDLTDVEDAIEAALARTTRRPAKRSEAG